jgi:hypothetical protein
VLEEDAHEPASKSRDLEDDLEDDDGGNDSDDDDDSEDDFGGLAIDKQDRYVLPMATSIKPCNCFSVC